MNERQANATGRALLCEAVGKLRAAGEFIGVTPDDVADEGASSYNAYVARIDEIEEWLFNESHFA